MKRALFIGGTGTISAAVTRLVASSPDWELFLINRGNRSDILPEGVRTITADINDEADVASKIAGMSFDCVCEFIGFRRSDAERDYRLFRGRTAQYMFISTASAYRKPVIDCHITESTPLCNPYWQYSRDKIACELFLMEKYREEGFPVTIVRPSHTYDERKIPMCLSGRNGTWQNARRLLQGKPVIIPGDGTSLWTLTHNSDFAKGFFGLMGNVHSIGDAYHITSDESLTWNQIYGCIADALGVELRARHISSDTIIAAGQEFDFRGNLLGDKVCSVIFDNSKIKAAVPGFHASVRFDQGVRRTVQNILEHPQYQYEDAPFDAWCDKLISFVDKSLENF